MFPEIFGTTHLHSESLNPVPLPSPRVVNLILAIGEHITASVHNCTSLIAAFTLLRICIAQRGWI